MTSIDMQGLAARAHADVETQTHMQLTAADASSLSINDWIDRIKGYALEAHSMARAGDLDGEYVAWLQMAAIATIRASHVLSALDATRET